MPVVTTTVKPGKAFAWSYSRIKAYEDCPRRYHETQVLKKWPEPKSEMLQRGDDVHAAMAEALRSGTPLPPPFEEYQHWVDRVHKTKGDLLVEAQWAIDKDYKPVEWFSPKTWLRCVGDAAVIDDDCALVVDWKTGKSANADILQLTLTSLMLFVLYPDLLRVRSDFVWLPEDAQTSQVIDRHEAAEQWAEIIPRVKRLEQATAENNFPPRSNNFCQSWCNVLSCEFNGRKK